MRDIRPGQWQEKAFAFEVQTKKDGLFSGYGSVFGNVDLGKEIIASGAFSLSLARIKASGKPLPALWSHDRDEPIGGYTNLTEDAKGLRFDDAFLMVDDVPRAKQTHALMKAGIVTGMSVGYRIEKYEWDETQEILTLTQLDLKEISPCVFPMNTEARITATKTAADIGTAREFEEFLRDSGFSKSESVRIASHGFSKVDLRESGLQVATAAIHSFLKGRS